MTKGGKREGAGRPPDHEEGRTKIVAATIPQALMEIVDKAAARFQATRSHVLTEAVRQWVRRYRNKYPDE